MVGRKKGWSTYRGKFAALKSKSMVLWKSQLVRDYLYLLEYDKDVLTYENCPVEVNYTYAGESHVLIPDLRVRRRNTLQLVKLVSSRDLTNCEGEVCLPAAPKQVEGYDLIILRELEVRQRPFLDNVKILWRYARVQVEAPQYQFLCLDFFRCRDYAPLSLGEVIKFFARHHLSEKEVFALLFHGTLSVDMKTELTLSSLISYTATDAVLAKGA
jgi:hypothetical protein